MSKFEVFIGVVITTLIAVLLITVVTFMALPRDYRNFYIDRGVGDYQIKQYVRYGVDIIVFSSTSSEETLRVYKDLIPKAQ